MGVREATLAVVLALILVCSFVFLLLPYSSILLTVREPVENWSNVTGHEWLWMVLTGACFLVAPPLSRLFRKSGRYLMSTTRAFRVFFLVNCLWMLASVYRPLSRLRQEPKSSRMWWRYFVIVGGKAAWPAMWNLFVLTIPVQRTSSILTLLGISTRDALRFHFWAGHATMLWLTLHTIALSAGYASTSKSLRAWLNIMLPYGDLYASGVVNFMGWVGYFAFGGLWISSLPWVRERAFNTFHSLHIIFAFLAIFFSQLHDYNTLFFVLPAIVGWIVDRLQRYTATKQATIRSRSDAQTNGCTTVSVVTAEELSLVELTFPIPLDWPLLQPGMFVYLRVPAVCRWQSHPFSISTYDLSARVFTIHVKALGDWTTNLVQHVKSMPGSNHLDVGDCSSPGESSAVVSPGFECDFEGPYGSMSLRQTLDQYQDCTFVAGGIGITGIMTLVQHRKSQGLVSVIVWLVQSQGEVMLFADWIKSLKPDPSTRLRIQITRGAPPEVGSSIETSELKSKSLPVEPSSMWTISTIKRREWATLAIAFVGAALSLVLSRQICMNEPEYVDGQRLHQCSFLGTSNSCMRCELNWSPYPNSTIPCCTVQVCYYCFRGMPILLAFLAVPVWTVVVSGALERIWRQLQSRCSMRRGGSTYLEIEREEVNIATSEGTKGNGDRDAAVTKPSENASSGLGPISVSASEHLHIQYGRMDLETMLTEACDLTTDDETNQRMAVAVCGPLSLRDAVTTIYQGEQPVRHDVYRFE